MRNLDALFRPRSVALFGADRQPHSNGRVVARNLFNAGFEGPILPVHPDLAAVEGVYTYRSVAALPIVPDLAVIASAAPEIPALLQDLSDRGTRAAVVVSADFDQRDRASATALRERVRDIAAAGDLRVVGPACLGVLVPGLGLNASIAHTEARSGDLAFVAQSGTLTAAMLDWAGRAAVGFSVIASLGDMLDVDFGDILDHLAFDHNTRAVLLCVERVTEPREFLSAARALARLKPVIVLKVGRANIEMATLDPAACPRADPDRVYEAAFRRAGILPVATISELVAAAETLASGIRAGGDRLAIISNGRGTAVLAADALARHAGRLAPLKTETIQVLAGVLPPGWGGGNPVNVFADASSERYGEVVTAVLADETADAVLVVIAPTAVSDPVATARAVAEAAKGSRKPLFAVWLDQRERAEVQRLLNVRGIASHDHPEGAISALMKLDAFHRNQEMLIETPTSRPEQFDCDPDRARSVAATAVQEGRSRLAEDEISAVLAAYGIPSVPVAVVASAEAAATVAPGLGLPVNLKIRAATLPQGGDDGSAFDLETAEAVLAASHRLERRWKDLHAGIAFPGFVVRAARPVPHLAQVRIAIAIDPLFGPVLVFGASGREGRGEADQQLALPPLNTALARRLIGETVVGRRLMGDGDGAGQVADEVALAVVKLAQLICDLGELVGLDIDPLWITADGVVAAGARGWIAPYEGAAEARLAIRPYPRELEKDIELKDGRRLHLRPIRPEDEPALQEFVKNMPPEDMRMRFFTVLKELDHRFAARLTQIDYDREMALIVVDPSKTETDILGVVRLSAEPGWGGAEYAIAICHDLKGQGLGRWLMEEIIAYGRARGAKQISGDVLKENAAMLGLVRRLGFTVSVDPDDPGVRKVRLELDPEKPLAPS